MQRILTVACSQAKNEKTKWGRDQQQRLQTADSDQGSEVGTGDASIIGVVIKQTVSRQLIICLQLRLFDFFCLKKLKSCHMHLRRAATQPH